MRALLLLTVLLPAIGHAMPDLRVDVADVHTVLKTFAADACELQPADRCVAEAGTRRLLRFGVLATNVGDTDLVMGVPTADALLPNGEPVWTYSACPSHQHWHFQHFARYALRVAGGGPIVVSGQKRSFCIADTHRGGSDASTQPRYCCRPDDPCELPGVQGIQAGWGDLYASSVDCQWIDVTDVAPGDYELVVELNPEGVLPEADRTNDVAVLPVSLEGPRGSEPAPRVTVKVGRKPRRAGHTIAVAWRARIAGGRKALRVQDVGFSTDGGATFVPIAVGLAPGVRRVRWTVPAGLSGAEVIVRVAAWSDAGHRGLGVSAPFAVRPPATPARAASSATGTPAR